MSWFTWKREKAAMQARIEYLERQLKSAREGLEFQRDSRKAWEEMATENLRYASLVRKSLRRHLGREAKP